MTGGIVFLDTETTGLDPERHELWDIAVIDEDGHEWNALIRPEHPETADPTSLRMNGYYDVFGSLGGVKKGRDLSNRRDIANILARLLAGKHIVGAVPSFDAAFLDRFLRNNGEVGTWHYHLIDVEVLIAGRLQLRPPYDSDALSMAVGVDPAEYNRHSALGDARWVKAQYEAVMSRSEIAV